jgi:glycosyltransferase involved in cell wall biosynthesis
MTATVIIPTTGSPDLRKAIDSVLAQTYETKCYVVVDGVDNFGKAKVITDEYGDQIEVARLPINVGANGFYGHRVYAAFTHLVNTEYVLYLDQDNWIEPNHVQTCVDTIEKTRVDWVYSLRNICDSEGTFITQDNCESLGKYKTFQGTHHVDTNCYCLKTQVAIKLAQAWHGGWGQDRVFLNALMTYVPKYECTGNYTLNYKLGGNEGSVKEDFFLHGNNYMNIHYKGDFPWRKKTY